MGSALGFGVVTLRASKSSHTNCSSRDHQLKFVAATSPIWALQTVATIVPTDCLALLVPQQMLCLRVSWEMTTSVIQQKKLLKDYTPIQRRRFPCITEVGIKFGIHNPAKGGYLLL